MKVTGLAISEKRGVRKKSVKALYLIKGYGVMGDSHGGTKREVSVLFKQDRDELTKNRFLAPGDCAENILIDGGSIKEVKIGDSIIINEVILKVIELGKEVHDSEIHRFTGVPVLPNVGIFCKVVKGGKIELNDEVIVK